MALTTGNRFRFLTEDLQLVIGQEPRKNITLADLNLSIGRALAAIYWYGKLHAAGIGSCASFEMIT